MGIVSIRYICKELAAGTCRVVEIKDMPMLRDFCFVQLQGQEGGLSPVSYTHLIKIGITGGIGSGKSMVSRLLEVLGVPVYISDLETKRSEEHTSELQ